MQINSVCGIGSTGRIATDIHQMLLEQGHESYIAYGRGTPLNCDNTIRIGSRIDNYIHVALTRLFDRHGFGSKKATKKFIKRIDEINPDIIHLHNIHGYYINIEILFQYLKKINKPVVWTLHDCWAFTGHCAYFDYVNCEKWKNGCHNCPEKYSYPNSLVIDNSRSNYKRKRDTFKGVKNLTIITPSNWLAKLVDESFLKEYRVRVINNGIDLNVFRPTVNNFRVENNLEDKFIILGVASGWSRRKGLKYFIDLSNKLSNNEIILLVGLSSEQIKQLPKGIYGITKTNNVKDLVDIYTSANVFVNPTLEDNFPTTNIESLACGTPVITFNTGGSPESIDNDTGSIIYEKDSNSLLKAIECYRLSGISSCHKCINRAHSFYDKNDRYSEYLRIYDEIVNKV